MAGPDERFIELTPDVLEGVTADDLRTAFLRAVAPEAGRRASTSTTWRRSARRSPTRWSSCSRSCRSPARSRSASSPASLVERLDVVVRFLAVLELFKQGFVDLDQPRTFGDIQIVWLGRDRSELEELSPVDAYDG